MAGARAQVHPLELFSATLSRIVIVPPIAVASAAQTVRDGRLSDADTLAFVGKGFDALIAEIELVRSRPATPDRRPV